MFSEAHSYAQVGKWFYWMESGAYATLTMSGKELPDVLSWSGKTGDPYTGLEFPNGTLVGFKNVSLTWKILEVDSDEALVEYILMLFDAYIAQRNLAKLVPVSLLGDVQLLSIDVWVRMDTLEVYSENRTYIGRWPFWVHNYEVGSVIVMVHDILKLAPVNGSFALTRQDEKIVLKNLDLKKEQSVGLETPYGFFGADRLLECGPQMVPVENTSQFISTGWFPALYDGVSLIMIAYGGTYIDDIICYMLGDMHNTFQNKLYIEQPLIINSTNIDLNPQDKPPSFELPLILSVPIVIGVVTAGVIIYVWKKKSR